MLLQTTRLPSGIGPIGHVHNTCQTGAQRRLSTSYVESGRKEGVLDDPFNKAALAKLLGGVCQGSKELGIMAVFKGNL